MKMRNCQRHILAAILVGSVSVQPLYAQDEINLDDLRRDLKQAGGMPAGFKPLDETEAAADAASKKLEEAEAQLLKQISLDGAQNGGAIDDGFGPAHPNRAEGESVKAAVGTRFLETSRPVEAEPAIESPAEVVAARVTAQDQAMVEAPPLEEPVISPKPERRTAEPQGKNKVAAIRRAAMVSTDAPSADEESVAELQDLIKRHGKIKADLKLQSDSAAKYKKKADDLTVQLEKSEAKVKALEQELTEARNRLMVSETEVERLSGLMVTTVRSSKSLAKLGSVQTDGIQRASSAAAIAPSRRPAETQPADEMPVATVVVEKANLRTGPGAEHSPLMSVTRGTRLLVEIRRGEWYRVISPSGSRAWVSADVVAFGSSPQASPSKTVRVKAFDPSLE
jgi:uncharacterized protein YgiM (DUF1202 family)